jgi:hypothetical protein
LPGSRFESSRAGITPKIFRDSRKLSPSLDLFRPVSNYLLSHHPARTKAKIAELTLRL